MEPFEIIAAEVSLVLASTLLSVFRASRLAEGVSLPGFLDQASSRLPGRGIKRFLQNLWGCQLIGELLQAAQNSF